MLDDLKYIHQKDGQDALGIAEKQWRQLEHTFDVPKLDLEVDNIVFAGMGGSALAARLGKTWPDISLPFEIVSDYYVPSYTSSKTLFIASSYSGNTEETLSALTEAEKAGAKIVIIAGGGELEHKAAIKKHVFIKLPEASQPRYAVLYSFKAFVTVLERAGVVKSGFADILAKQVAEFLHHEIENWKPTVPAKQNLAKQIALDVVGKSPVIYGGSLYPAAYKWKISFNENAKNVAWCNAYPEFNHNEFMGWSSHPIDKPYAVINLQSSYDHPQIKKRFAISKKLLSGKMPDPIEVQAKGESVPEQLLWTVVLGDFVSLYTALLNGLNPTPVDLIEKLKKELA